MVTSKSFYDAIKDLIKQERDLEIKYIKTAELIPYARNSRTHSEQQVQQIASSIK